jgi:diguanylate cyclase (GGDEF)-like protein
MPLSALLVFGGALILLLNRFLISNDTILAGYIGALGAVFLAITTKPIFPGTVLFFTAAGIILIVSSIESSYYMAYIDELTLLHGRRSLNETLINLGSKYAIAMIDVDRFKKINDSYGHKTGDQVLRMIAVQLEKITGGAKTFRYGGEEFAAVFPGKSAEDAQLHLEQYRLAVASTPFVVRSKQRRKSSEQNRGKGKTAGQKTVNVTVSIGVAAPDKNLTNPEAVLKAADQVMYKAKKAGRNRVMVQKAAI